MRRATRIRSGEGRGRVDEEARSTDKGTGRRGPARSGQGDYLIWFKYTVYDLRKYNGTYGIIYWYVWSKY